MFAISFDMVVSDLKEYYGNSYNNAYYEISNTQKESIMRGIEQAEKGLFKSHSEVMEKAKKYVVCKLDDRS